MSLWILQCSGPKTNMYALIGAHFTPMAVGPQPMPPPAAAGLQAGAPVGAQGGAQAVAATGAGQAVPQQGRAGVGMLIGGSCTIIGDVHITL